jgi:hypothetical protein
LGGEKKKTQTGKKGKMWNKRGKMKENRTMDSQKVKLMHNGVKLRA